MQWRKKTRLDSQIFRIHAQLNSDWLLPHSHLGFLEKIIAEVTGHKSMKGCMNTVCQAVKHSVSSVQTFETQRSVKTVSGWREHAAKKRNVAKTPLVLFQRLSGFMWGCCSPKKKKEEAGPCPCSAAYGDSGIVTNLAVGGTHVLREYS